MSEVKFEILRDMPFFAEYPERSSWGCFYAGDIAIFDACSKNAKKLDLLSQLEGYVRKLPQIDWANEKFAVRKSGSPVVYMVIGYDSTENKLTLKHRKDCGKLFTNADDYRPATEAEYIRSRIAVFALEDVPSTTTEDYARIDKFLAENFRIEYKK